MRYTCELGLSMHEFLKWDECVSEAFLLTLNSICTIVLTPTLATIKLNWKPTNGTPVFLPLYPDDEKSQVIILSNNFSKNATWSEIAWSANQHPKSTVKKKPTNLCALREFLKKMCPPCLIIMQSCFFDYRINKPFIIMFLLRDLFFVLCSRDLDVPRAQRIIGFFILITHNSTRLENPLIWCTQDYHLNIYGYKRIQVRLPTQILENMGTW